MNSIGREKLRLKALKKDAMGEIMELDKFKQMLARRTYGMTKQEAHQKGVCISCRKPVNPKTISVFSRREYTNMGLCEPCLEQIFDQATEEAA